MKKLNTPGKIVTFYSYKGGVGRSMSLANVAVLLAQWGYKTLIIDWDLEAPGLENFYSDHIAIKDVNAKKGLIDILVDETNDDLREKTNWKDCIVPVFIEAKGAFKPISQLDLITAGNLDDRYYEKVKSFDFNTFYEEHDGGEKIEKLRSEWAQEYDFVLIDSRTGVTDIGGVCTVQLPDILVVLFTPTVQSLQGVKRIANKAMAAQRKLPYDRINLLTLPIPTRIDNSEYKLSKEWFETMEVELRDIYKNWIADHENFNLYEFLLNSKIPYISYFSFGENLPVLEEGVKNPTSMGYSYQSLAALLATRLNHAEALLLSRDLLIDMAENPEGGQKMPYNVFEDTKKSNVLTAKKFAKFLTYKVRAYILVIVAFVCIGMVVLFTELARQDMKKENEISLLAQQDSISKSTAAEQEKYKNILLVNDSLKAAITEYQQNASYQHQKEMLLLKTRNVSLDIQVDSLKGKYSNLQQTYTALQKQEGSAAKYKQEISDLNATNSKLQQEIQDLRSENKGLKKKLGIK